MLMRIKKIAFYIFFTFSTTVYAGNPIGGVAPDTAGGGGSNFAGGNSCQKTSKHGDSTISCECNSSLTGMPNYTVNLVQLNLIISDIPLPCSHSIGPNINVMMTYNQGSDFNTNHPTRVGNRWSINWINYLQINGDPKITSNVSRFVPGGAVYNYAINSYNSASNQYSPEVTTQAVIQIISTSPIKIKRLLPNGGAEYYETPTSLTYPTKLLLTRQEDEFGNSIFLSYDNQSRLMVIEDASGKKINFEYNELANNSLISSIKSGSREVVLKYDNRDNLISITDAIGLKSSFNYNSSKEIISMTTPYGTTSFSWGNIGDFNRGFTVVDPKGEKEYFERTALANDIPFNYPNEGSRPDNRWMHGRNVVYWDKTAFRASGFGRDVNKGTIYHYYHSYYVDFWKMSNVLESIKKPLENAIWFNVYNQTGADPNITSGSKDLITAVGRYNGNQYQTTAYLYNDWGNVTQTTDPLGRVTYSDYAANGIDLIAVRQKSANGSDRLLTMTYNDKHLPLTITGADGKTTAYTYNARGQVLTQTNALNETTTYTYTSSGELASVVGANGQTLANYRYDDAGRLITRQDNTSGEVESYDYDPLNRLIRTTFADASTEEITYDKLDIVAVKDRLGRTTRTAYDANRNKTSETDANGGVTRYEYDPDGRIIKLTDPNGNITQWVRDIQGRVTQEIRADGNKINTTYDLLGRVSSVTNGRKQLKTLSYNLDNTVKKIQYSDNTPAVDFTYHASYRRISTMKDNAGTHVFVFNSAGNPGAMRPAGELMVVGSNVLAHSLIYDALGRLQERRIASLTSAQHSETVGYDVLGRVKSVANPLGNFNYDYDGVSGRLHQESLQGKNFMTNYVYENAAQDYRLKSIARSGVIGAVPKMAYSTDAYRILNKNTEGGEQQSLRYDALDRLTGVVVSGVPNLIRNENYQYDATDNLTISAVVRLKDGNLFMKASEFNGQAMNRVKDETAFYNQKRAWVYDADGNVTSDGEAQYAWDAENRLKSVTKNGVTSTFAYDGLGRLHSRAENGTTTFYKWCDSDIKPCAAYGSDGKPKTLYLAQGEYEIASGAKKIYLRDHLGSVQDVVSDSGTSLWHGEYTAYGQLMAERGDAVNRPQFGYAGMMKHYASGLNLTRFRAYHPEKGRWLSTDPIGFAGGRNLYGYVGGNPINRIDIFGLYIEDIYNLIEIIKNKIPSTSLAKLPEKNRIYIGNSVNPFVTDYRGSTNSFTNSITLSESLYGGEIKPEDVNGFVITVIHELLHYNQNILSKTYTRWFDEDSHNDTAVDLARQYEIFRAFTPIRTQCYRSGK